MEFSVCVDLMNLNEV